MPKCKLTFEFPSLEARYEFVSWLCEGGEQDYWSWCFHPDGGDNLAAVTFDYWNTTNEGKNFVGNSDKEEVTVLTEKYKE
jgi:hypothetical protein